ncbi:hypothetical protein LDENG_00074570 [Lucifuga dentata]|nr:hypothetical protein LDENG_00074570 [Lucifuga dentata]
MPLLEHIEKKFSPVFLPLIVTSILFQGALCVLEVSPPSRTLVSAIAGTNVTLAVSFTGALDPALTWSMGALPVVTWTINSPTSPDIDINHKNVLMLETNGSLTFANVPVDYSNIYTIEMTKSGLGTATTSFTLKVFEIIKNVTLSTDPAYATEGNDKFTLQYSMLQGVVESQTWFFNGMEIKNDSHYSLEQTSLVICMPNRKDGGQYKLVLTNPFSSVTTYMNITVLYGPDEPMLNASPAQPFYVSGDSLILSCQAEGFPQPTAEWVFDGQSLSNSKNGVLNLTKVQTSQGGTYTCMLVNEKTGKQRQKNMMLNVYERPLGAPICSVQALSNNTELQYQCQWSGGDPQAGLSFPVLSNTSSGAGDFNLTVAASANLSGKTVTCLADHPVEQNKCNVTACSPMDFLPVVRTTVDLEAKIVVTIDCVSKALPQAVVSWSKGSELVTNGTKYQISSDTSELRIRNSNVSSFLLQNYTCTCRNPLGSRRRQIQLLGPSISDSSLFPNQDGTIATLTWEILPTSVVTGFDIQMKGPELLSDDNSNQNRGISNEYHSIQQKPGSARSADIMVLNPKSTYRFRVLPVAGNTKGEPSEVHRIGPGGGLSGPAIAGIAAGIPCSLLFLLLLCGLIYLCLYYYKKRSRQTRYPVSRAVEKVTVTSLATTITSKAAQADTTPHNLLTGRLKSPPDYNQLHQAPSERSVALPTFVPPPPVRIATTV